MTTYQTRRTEIHHARTHLYLWPYSSYFVLVLSCHHLKCHNNTLTTILWLYVWTLRKLLGCGVVSSAAYGINKARLCRSSLGDLMWIKLTSSAFSFTWLPFFYHCSPFWLYLPFLLCVSHSLFSFCFSNSHFFLSPSPWTICSDSLYGFNYKGVNRV